MNRPKPGRWANAFVIFLMVPAIVVAALAVAVLTVAVFVAIVAVVFLLPAMAVAGKFSNGKVR